MKTTILLMSAIFMLSTGCKKEGASARQTQYIILAKNNSGISGTVTFIDQPDSAQTIVDIEVSGTTHYMHMSHIHEGIPSAYHQVVYAFDPIYERAGRISHKQSIPLLYDSAVVFNGTFVLHDSTGNDGADVLGLCGIGINK